MITTVRAAYKGGVLEPEFPLPLTEGQSVYVTVTPSPSTSLPAIDDEDAIRLRSAKTIDEWIEATSHLPSDEGGYDILEALNENRRFSGDSPIHA